MDVRSTGTGKELEFEITKSIMNNGRGIIVLCADGRFSRQLICRHVDVEVD